MTWIRGMVSALRGARSFVGPLTLASPPLNRLPYPGETSFSPSFRYLVLADGALLQIGTKKGRFQRAYLQKCTMTELSGQASGPRSPYTRYPRVTDSERVLYRQVFCRDIVIDNAEHVVFAS